ncbi:MAG: transketolase C-terminal domain-containing protein [Desulfuromonadaceae bacterium]|nr:transketolase C-terminal domain-containing protein [Desulfuromonadaceae bacterium]MDD2855343.1 transketolase C-terminal domain-containing protein [Desulfuromonadaceae bacterium]
MRNAFIDTIIDACSEREDIFILSGDAGLGVFDQFKEKHPDRFRNMGIAEQNTISFASGLALSGYKVFVYNIIPFLFYRCYEQVRNDICYQELPIVLVGVGSGITYAPMGMTHYSVEDIGLIQTLPNLVTISPMDPVEARAAAVYSLNSEKPVYIRLAKRGEPVIFNDSTFDITAPRIVRDGEWIAVVFHGSISDEVLEAYESLKNSGIAPLLVSVPTLQPLDAAGVISILSKVDHVVCVEEHFVNSGLGSMLARLKTEQSAQWGLTLMGVPYGFIHEVGNCEYLRSFYGISASEIIRTVTSISGAH